MKKIFGVNSKNQLRAGILRAGLVMVYAVLIICSAWLLKEYSVGYIIGRIIPYGIPPLLSLVSAVFLSLFVLSLEQTRTESLLFAAICMVFGILNLDIFLLGIISDPKIALVVSRIDHFFLALILAGANLHLVFLVCDKKKHWWIVYAGYAVGGVMALFTPTRYYFQGIYTYYWGFFAKKSVLYDVMSVIWLFATVYCIALLSWTYRRTQNIHRKNTIIYIILGFVSSAVLSLTNTPAIYGHEIYPLGTFIFISLFLLAFGLFKYNLRIAVQQLREGIFSVGILVIITFIGFIPWMILPQNKHQLIKIVSGILLAALFYTPVRGVWDSLLNLAIKRATDMLQKEYYALTFRLSSTNHIKAIYEEISQFLFRVFLNSRCAMVFYNHNNNSFEGWRRWNIQHDAGFFKTPTKNPDEEKSIQIPFNHPLLRKLLLENPPLATRSIIDQWTFESKITPDPSDWMLEAGIIIPIYSQSRTISLLMMGNKLNDRSYSAFEKGILRNLGVFLGPIIENANILEGLEFLVEKRTRDLHRALEDANHKSDEIIQNNKIITQQNHIFLSLFETSTKIHEIKEFDELFNFTLRHLRSLFPDLGFGILLEGERASIFEGGAFAGVSYTEQNIILKNRMIIESSTIDRIIKTNSAAEDPKSLADDAVPDKTVWTILPMRAKDNRNIGKIVIKGPGLDSFAETVISIFIAQVSSAVQNKFLLRRLETIANTDGLTGAASRSFFDQAYETAVKNTRHFQDIHFSMLIIDINGLKQVNDSYGHVKGDEMIKSVARFLKSQCRTTDILSRIGGDEFAVLLPSISSREAQHVLARIRQKEKELVLVCMQKDQGEKVIPIKISIGLAGSDETEPEKVIKLADERMYMDKEKFYRQNPVGSYSEIS
jgi:diguanylate cyclase (GGDEF)-like protein